MLERILRKILPYRIVRKDDYMVRFFLWGSRGYTDSNSGPIQKDQLVARVAALEIGTIGFYKTEKGTLKYGRN